MRFVRLPQENVHIYAFTGHYLYCQKFKCYKSLPLTVVLQLLKMRTKYGLLTN